MLDFLLSKPGQISYATEGKFPGRPDVTREELGGGDTRASFEADVGKDKVILMDYDPALTTGYDAFVAKWKAANGVS